MTDFPLLSDNTFIAELSRAKRGSGAPWVRKWSNLPTNRPPAWPSVRTTLIGDTTALWMQSNLYQANSSESSSHLPKSQKSFPLITVKLTCIKGSPLLSSRDHRFWGDQVHSCNTRNSNTSYLFPGLSLQGPEAFNSFNHNIQSAATTSLFKSRLKTFFFSWFTTCHLCNLHHF